MTASLMQGVAAAEQPDTKPPAAPSEPAPSAVATEQRENVLGSGWKTSKDRAWTTSGDALGLHILVADADSGYGWRTAASLSEPGFDADLWIGNVCVTGSGRRAVAAYAPRTFTNKAELMARGAFTAVVDLETGKVTKLDLQASLAYFSPGCGTGETAIFTQSGGEDKNATRLVRVDASKGRVGRPLQFKGQVTSAVPIGSDIVAADGARVVKIDAAGRRSTVAKTDQIPFLLKPDAEGGLVFMDRSADPAGQQRGDIKRLSRQNLAANTGIEPKVLASGPLAQIDLTSSADGQVFVTGQAEPKGQLPKTMKWQSGIPKESRASTSGKAMVTQTAWADGRDSRITPEESSTQRSVKISLKVLPTDKVAEFEVLPGEEGVAKKIGGGEISPALPQQKNTSAQRAQAVEEEGRVCSVARNDPAKQAMQPKPRQVEWAVDQAITGNLNQHISRPANWKNLGMPAYRPQDADMFPLTPLAGGGRIPSQVMLGVTAQESNMWQASRVVVPGVTGNPLIGNYYGIAYTSSGQQTDPWAIDWSKADCGYGVTQQTDGMRLPGNGQPTLTVRQQEAIALDYTANIAAGVNTLAEKWNQTRAGGLTVDNGDPKYAENWFFALWAYNSGYYPQSEAANNNGKWGVGFTNNPANPIWKANRLPFLENASGGDNYADAAHPQDWPYQEKVLGWAARPLFALESPGTMVAGFRAAWWTTTTDRTAVKPPQDLFCTTANECDPSKITEGDSNEPGMGACTRTDLMCWWNQPVTWKSCAAGKCANEVLRFDATYPEQADGTAYPPNCTTNGLPTGAIIVDDVPDNIPIHRPGCTPVPTGGTFTFDFGTDSAKIDLHQLGAGFNSHFWFAHGRDKLLSQYDRLRVTGTWKLDGQLSQPQARVLVHLPDHGAQVPKALYEIETSGGTRTVEVDQRGTNNRWVDLGVFGFQGVTPEVRLSNLLVPSDGELDVAYDAVAFVPGTWPTGGPDIVLPEADPDAPEYEATHDNEDPPTVTDGSLVIIPAGGRVSSPNSTSNCSTPQGNESDTICMRIDKTKKLARKDLPVSVREAAVGSCPIQSAEPGKTAFSRLNSCETYVIEFIRISNGTVVGTASFGAQRIIGLWAHGPEFEEMLWFWPLSSGSVPLVMSPMEVELGFSCVGACEKISEQWNRSPTWTNLDGPDDVSYVETTYRWTNQNSSTTRRDEMDLHTSMTLETPRLPGESTGAEISDLGEWYSPDLQIRCDNEVYGDVGCVFHKYIPTYTIDSKKYPTSAAMYWLAMEKFPSHPGSKDHNAPLHREGRGESYRTENYNWVCGSYTYFKAHPDSLIGPDGNAVTGSDVPQCDEYPFASTLNSAGSALTPGTLAPKARLSGTKCAQVYATKKTGQWILHIDESQVPTWTEPCIRGAIPTRDNGGTGAGVGGVIVGKYRILHNDPYWLEIPGMDGCSPSASLCHMLLSD